MKIIALNGSPRKDGNTYTSLSLAGKIFEKEGIDFEIIHIKSTTKGCMACGMCSVNKNEKCVIDDEVNDVLQKLKEADGIILGSPVYYAGVAGSMKAFLDRLFYVAGSNGNMFAHKVGASLVSVRRSGGSTTFDALNKYLLYSEMIVPTANYWNIIHGTTKEQVLLDKEGIQIIERLSKNMAWVVKMREATKDTLLPPAREDKIFMNFIR